MTTTWTNILNGAATTVGATPGDAIPATALAEVLQISNQGAGVDATLRSVVDGSGDAVPLQVSTSAVMLPNAAIWPYGDSTFFSAGQTGILIPYYLYPNNPYTDVTVTRLLNLIRQYRGRVPVIVVINPGSGPGSVTDGNYTAFIKLIQAAGGKVAGYVSTAYAVRAEAAVKADVDSWLALYADAKIDTIFFDEQTYDLGTDNANVALYKRYTDYCHARNLAPVICNPGTNQREEYFATRTGDIIVVAETGTWPTESDMLGAYVGGHIDYKASLRCALVYGQSSITSANIRTLAKCVQWIYATDDALSPNPWDSLSTHLERTFSTLADDAGTITATGSTTGRNLSDWFADVVNVKSFGAVGNLTANDTTAIQAAINSITVTLTSRQKGGVVFFPPGTYRVSSTITLPEFVTLQGSGTEVTIIYLSNGANCDVIKTKNFATLTGSGNARLNTAGVPCQFGVRDLMIHGNRFNNTSGTCLKIYGYNYIIDNVMCYAGAEDGFYSEHGLGTDSYVQAPTNQIESHVSNLRIRDCLLNGMNWDGPTDAVIESVFVAYSGQDGIRLDRTTYGTASVDLQFAHAYACGGRGIYINAPIRAGHICGESNVKEGIYFDTGSYASQVEFIEAYLNDTASAGTYYQVNMAAGGGSVIGQTKITCSDATDIGGLLVASDGNMIDNALVIGANPFVGLAHSITGSKNTCTLGTVLTGAGSTGIKLDGSNNRIVGNLRDVSTAVAHATATTGNQVEVTASLRGGGTLLSGVAFGATESYSASDGTTSSTIQSGKITALATTSGQDATISFASMSAHAGAGTFARMGIESGDTSAWRLWVPNATTGVAVLGQKYDNNEWTISCNNGVRLVVGSDGALYHQTSLRKFLDLNTHHMLRQYTVATLPAVGAAGAVIGVSDGSSNRHIAVSDGVSWRFPDGAVVS